VRVVTKSCYEVGMAPHRMLIYISRSEHRVLDPDDVYFLQADDGLSAFGESATPNHNSPRIGSRFAGNYWWTRTRRIRTTAAIPVNAPILELKPPPIYQRIASRAKHLHELGMNQSEIGRRLDVDRWTVGKAVRWIAKMGRD